MNENIGHGKDYDGSEFFGGGSNNTARDFGGDSDRNFETPEIDTTELSSTESAFESESNPVAESMKDLIRGATTEQENSNTGDSLDTAFQIGDKSESEIDYDEEERNRMDMSKMKTDLKKGGPFGANKGLKAAKEHFDKYNELAEKYGLEKLESPDVDKMNAGLKEMMDKQMEMLEGHEKARADSFTSELVGAGKGVTLADGSEAAEETPSEIMEEAKGPGNKMKNAKPSTSDYLTSANKDAPKTARDTHDNFLEHALDTTAGAMDRVSKTTTDLGIKDLKAWAEENGKDPSKLSTMRAYNAYQTREIVKAIPGVMKEVGSYIEERVKDAFDPSKLGTRVANTLARYNAATLIGAAILSLKHGANFTEALDMALSSVDPADVPEVREALENALNDDSLVDDVSTLIDDAYSNMNSSKQDDLDSEIVNIGRKNNTDYSGFNQGLGTSSDKDVKVFISRNVKSDPILRTLIKHLGK